MNTQREVARRIDEEISNAGVPPKGNQLPPLEFIMMNKLRSILLPWWMGHKGSLLKMAQAITTQTQDVTTQAQAMTAQANRKVVPLENQHVGTMASRLRDFSRMNTLTFYGSKVEEDLQDFIDKTYKIFYAMGSTTSEKVEFSTYQLKDVDQTWYIQ